MRAPPFISLVAALALLAPYRAQAQDIIANPGFHAAEVDAGPPHVPQLTKAPQLLHAVTPEYPEEAKAQQLTGEVTLQITLGPDGRVTDVTVAQPAGHGFDEAAVAAARQFVFSPAEIDDKPASVRISYTQHFVYTAPVQAPPADGGAPPAPTRPISITGRILERATRKPIANAAVTTQPSTSAEPVLTGPDGSFELRAAPGQVMIMVQEGAHHAFNTLETLKAGERLAVTYYMMPKSYGLYETVVHGEREKKEVSRYTLQGDELQKVPGSFGDPLRVITDLPGVARPPFGLGLLVIEGANPGDTGTYMDGIQLPLLYHFLAGPSVINPEFLDRIDFYPGGFGSEYGRAIGGIIDVDTKAPKEEWHGSAKVDLLDADFYLQAPIVEGLMVSAAARRSYVDAVLAAALPIISSTAPTVAPSYYDYQLRLDYKPPHTHQQWGLFFFGSDDLLDVVNNGAGAQVSVNEHVGFKRLAASWAWHSDEVKVSVKPFAGYDTTSVGFDTEQIDVTSYTGGLRELTEWQPSKVFTLRGGLDLLLTKNTLSTYFAAGPTDYVLFPGAANDAPLERITESLDEYDYGAWTEGIITLPAGLKLIPGLRADAFRYNGDWHPEVDPRLVLRQDFTLFGNLASAWKASIGEYHEAAPAQDLEPTFGNPNIGLQGAIQSSLGVEQHFTDALHVELTGFYNRRYDLAVGVNEVITNPDGTLTRVRLDNEGLGRAYGLMVLLKQEITQHFFGWLAYTLSWSEEKAPGQPDYTPTEFDQRHNLIAVAQYKFGNGWEVGGRFQLTTGSPTTLPMGAVLSADTGSYQPIEGPTDGARLPTFQELDLRVDRDFYFDRWMLGVYLDVLNVYNATNQEAVIYDYRYRTSTPVPGIPFFPTLGIKGSF